MAADRYNFNKSWEHIQNKYVGTGHPDITKFEWAMNQHRDTITSNLGHHDMLAYFALAQNDSIGRVRYQLLEVSPPPSACLSVLTRWGDRGCSSHVDHRHPRRMKM